MLTGLVVAFAKELAAAITRGRSNPNEKAHRACDRSRTDCFRWCMGLCLLRGDVKHDARCGLASRPLQPIRKDLVIRFRRQRLAREAIMAAKEISVKKYVVRLSG